MRSVFAYAAGTTKICRIGLVAVTCMACACPAGRAAEGGVEEPNIFDDVIEDVEVEPRPDHRGTGQAEPQPVVAQPFVAPEPAAAPAKDRLVAPAEQAADPVKKKWLEAVQSYRANLPEIKAKDISLEDYADSLHGQGFSSTIPIEVRGRAQIAADKKFDIDTQLSNAEDKWRWFAMCPAARLAESLRLGADQTATPERRAVALRYLESFARARRGVRYIHSDEVASYGPSFLGMAASPPQRTPAGGVLPDALIHTSDGGAVGGGMHFPNMGGGIVNPQNGAFLLRNGSGFVDTQTGRFIPGLP